MTREMTTEEVKEDNKENKEEEKMTRIGKKNPLLPTVLWAQRRDRIFLTFEIKKCDSRSIQLEVRNPYPLEAMEEEEGKGAALGYVGTSAVVFSCESLDVCGEEEEEKEGILMIDDCSMETVGEKLKRQAFGGEEEEEEEASPTSVVDGQQRLRSLSLAKDDVKSTRTPSNWNFTTPFFPTKSRINSPSRIKPSTWFSSNQNQLRTGLDSSPRAKSSATSKPTLTAGKTKTKSWKTRTSSRSTRTRC